MAHLEGLRADSSQFTLRGEPFRILGGSIHYFRVPRPYWKDRLLKMKACALNTLTTYVPWNLHEPERGAFNFQDQLDLREYVSLAAEIGFWVILRPGPYICAEWDLGGLPSWLLQDKDMQLRTTYPGFVNAVNVYFDKLVSVIQPLTFENGGPVIALQLENEYGSYAKDEEYMPFLKNCLRSRGINELLLTSDNWEGLRYKGMEGVLKTINLQRLSFGAIQHLACMQPQKPLLVMEYWSGWFDVWGEHHHVFHAEDMLGVVSEILERGVSVNLYMFHGGTNFGFMNGAMDFGAYKPQVTSYDYDAPLSEAGGYTKKYEVLRDLFSRYNSEPLPEVPSPQERKAYETVFTQQNLSLWDSIQFTEKPFRSERPINMENLPVNNNSGQSYGYTLYETSISSGGALNSGNNIRDRALVFLDKQYVGCLDYKTHEIMLPDAERERTLAVLVENCGRVNYGKALDNQRKGIVGDIVLNDTRISGFNIFCLDLKPSFIKRLLSTAQWKTDFKSPPVPGFFMAKLIVDDPPKDTFIKLPDWGKGVVFVNGQNLGRYWCIGPQHFLYLPGPYLRSGENQIIVFEEEKVGGKILFSENPEYGKTIDVYKLPFCSLL
ncbi:beta-galactosidase-1-like protein 2 [Cyprinodon tularosa]|uniref:beta-galactosidase-1-like protein 2 n=1 Tax=Cyprinodon tularosa TaxID=77115 RepID=UPI0018E28154|nr:beta-galactosidase-1-like protein 2 [Cyprinodon tularosa]XP_038123839.1 beta-galactosidase-1-like protein 2 [Cyprinodon tularosa]